MNSIELRSKDLIMQSVSKAFECRWFHWEANKPYASSWRYVTKVAWSGEDIMICHMGFTRKGITLDPNPQDTFWHEIDVFVAATSNTAELEE